MDLFMYFKYNIYIIQVLRCYLDAMNVLSANISLWMVLL